MNDSSQTKRIKLSRLPICDLLFCAVSLILLITQMVLMIFTILYFYSKWADFVVYFCTLLAFFLIGLLATNGLSIYWYLKHESPVFRSVDLGLHICLHVFQISLLWRYVILLRRIRLDSAKLLICELCSLRILYSTIVSFISCLILLYFSFKTWFDVPLLLSTTSVICFCDFCWALSSFNRKTRRDRTENLVLCWPGIIGQFLWRSGTVGSRTVALALYASFYSYYILLVVMLHWILMFIGTVLVFPPSNSAQARQKLPKRLAFGALLGVFYIVFFFNPSKYKTKRRFAYFYCVMFAENSLLATIWIVSSLSIDSRWTGMHTFVAVIVWLGFLFGISWMLLYYRYLHATVLSAKHNSTNQILETQNVSSYSSQPAVFACTAQIPFRKQPSRFHLQSVPLAQSASASAVIPKTTEVAVELAERRSRSVPAVNRKNRRSREESAYSQNLPIEKQTSGRYRTNSNSYPKRYHEANRVAVLSSANANNFRQSEEWSDSSEELATVLSKPVTKTKRLRPTSVGSIVLRTMDDGSGRERIETVF